jgi:sarcosine oxidase, subunit beta
VTKNASPDIVICGAGIAGVSAAYHLAVKHGVQDILLVDQGPPLSLTSDKSTECYRNWWPGPGSAMIALMDRSIDLLEELAQESNNIFQLSRRGYMYVTGDGAKILEMVRSAENISALGAGPLRIHPPGSGERPYIPSPPHGYTGVPEGADLILDPAILRRHFPYLTEEAVAALHVRRAGWFSGQQLGSYLLDCARAAGVRYTQGRVQAVDIHSGRVQAVVLEDGRRITTGCFINAAGPLLKQVGEMLDVELPVYTEPHLKVAFKDTLAVVPREAPLLIWSDPQRLPWSGEERDLLAEDEQAHPLLQIMPAGVHTRPEGRADSNILLMLWEYNARPTEPVWPLPLDPDYPDVLLRGLATMLPGLQVYFERSERPFLDGGYYTKTAENRPLVGPLPVQGAYLIGALSGFGLMAACAAGELLALHVMRRSLPDYAPAFMLERYHDRQYIQAIAGLHDTGQL